MITIVMTTYFPNKERLLAANETINSWKEHIKFNSPLNLHVADDGTEFLNIEDSFNNLLQFGDTVFDRTTYSFNRQRGVGESLNKGFAKAFESSPYVLYAVDDWALTQDFDLTPWIEVLEKREDVGMVRLGPPHPHTEGKIEPLTDNWQSWGLRLNRKGYAFGHRPAMYHKRMIDCYGWFKTDCSAIECEKDYSHKVNSNPLGPDVVLALPHPWQHIYTTSMSEVNPSERTD
jgi:hypothetical protein